MRWLGALLLLPLLGAGADPAGGAPAATSGELASPGYPDSYPSDHNSAEEIDAGPGNIVLVHFTDLDIENSTNCQYDSLRIREGDGTELLAPTCGRLIPVDLRSRTQRLQVVFRTDSSISGRGWRVTWTTAPANAAPVTRNSVVPGILITGGHGTWSSVESWPAAPCPLPALPEGRAYHSMSITNGRTLVVCGGYPTTNKRSCKERVPGQDWRPLSPDLREERAYHSAVSAGDSVILVGGQAAGSKRTAEVVPGGATFPLLHDGDSSCSILLPGTRDFVVTGGGGGGGGGYGTPTHRHVDRYSLSGEQLSSLPPLLTVRRNHACAAFRDSAGRTALLVLGGEDGSNSRVSSAEVLPGLEAGSWQTAAPLPRRLKYLRAATLPGGSVLATGGEDSTGTDRAEVLRYVEGAGPGDGDSWVEEGRMEEARRFHAIVAIDLNLIC